MTYFSTARVAIVDDDPEEAFPIIEALGKNGVGAIYFRGDDASALPSKPIDGLRLVFMDMDLGYGGSFKQIVSGMLAVIDRIVGEGPAPVAIVVWTKHPDHFDGFKDRLSTEFPNLIPGAILGVDKHEFLPALGGDIEKLFDKVKRSLDLSRPVSVISAWEQLSHHAVTLTSNELVKISCSSSLVGSETREDRLSGLLKGLADSSAGKTLNTKNVSGHLLDTLAIVQSDFFDKSKLRSDGSFSWIAKISELSDPKNKAQLHEYLWTTELKGDPDWSPGSVAIIEDIDSCFAKENGLEPASLARNFGLTANSVRDVVKLRKNIVKCKYRRRAALEAGDKEKAKINKDHVNRDGAILDKLCAKILSHARACIIEVSPACDHAQNKRLVLRFIAGLYVDVSDPDMHKVFCAGSQGDYVTKLEVFTHGEANKEHVILCNLRHHITVPVGLIEFKPSFMLRNSVVAELIASHSSYAARPGILKID